MATNPLLELHKQGQSVWYDSLRRGLIRSGELKRMIDEDGLAGVTSNPTILDKAIAGSNDYADAVEKLLEAGATPDDIYESLVLDDIRAAADVLRPVYDATQGGDGFVSLEVSPALAHDTAGHDRPGAPLPRRGQPAQPDGQGAGHAGRHARHPRADRRGHQHQRHPHLLAGRLPPGHRRLFRRAGAVGRSPASR